MQQLFIINPTAGKTDASAVLVPQIQAAASRAGVVPRIEITRSRGHAWPKRPLPAAKKYISMRLAAMAQ